MFPFYQAGNENQKDDNIFDALKHKTDFSNERHQRHVGDRKTSEKIFKWTNQVQI